MNLNEILHSIGLEPKEISIYLASLELGDATILEIAKKAGIKRPTAYVVLNSLEQKGFVTKIIKDKKSIYSPDHPKKLITETEFKLHELKQAVPQLESLFNKERGKPRISVYSTKDESDRASDEMFVAQGEALYMGTLQLSQQAFPKTFRKAELAQLSPEFKIRELIDDSEQNREYAKRVSGLYREVRFLPHQLIPFEVDISIFSNRTLITSVKKEHFTVGIESEEINHAFRGIFEAMWSVATVSH